jgi:hypothetical protein
MKTRKDLIGDINSLEYQIKQEIENHLEDLQRSPATLISVRRQLDEWKELVGPVTRGKQLGRKQDLERAYTIAFNIYNQIQYQWRKLN